MRNRSKQLILTFLTLSEYDVIIDFFNVDFLHILRTKSETNASDKRLIKQ